MQLGIGGATLYYSESRAKSTRKLQLFSLPQLPLSLFMYVVKPIGLAGLSFVLIINLPIVFPDN